MMEFMKKNDIVIDLNNPYVRGLVKAIQEFMYEESGGCMFTESRLKKKIEELKDVFGEERKRMMLSGNIPKFDPRIPDDFRIVFASREDAGM